MLLINLNRVLNSQNERNVVAFQEPEERFVAICSFQCINEPTLELGYDVIKKMRGKGIGTQMAKAFFRLAHACFLEKELIIKVRKENMASRRVAEKCGATFVGLTDAPEVETIQRLLNENKETSLLEEATVAIERGKTQ